MSIMRCDKCSNLVDTDEKPESLYIVGHDCLCEWCLEKALASGEIAQADLADFL